MSRSGYSDNLDNWALIKWRGQVTSATRGKRGQQLFRDLAEAMDAMPIKELIAHELEDGGKYCALGVVGAKRGLDLKNIDPDDQYDVSRELNIARALACEIAYQNDDCGPWLPSHGQEALADRWTRMRNWIAEQISKELE